MKKGTSRLLICLLLMKFCIAGIAQSDICTKPFRIVVLGSSTSYGTGAVPMDSSWVNKYRAYLKSKNIQSDVINLAVSGYNTYKVLCPTAFVPPAGRPLPDTLRNITKALSYNPNAIIINLPTNDVASGYSLSEQKANYERTIALANAAKVPVWVTTSQPRNLTAALRDTLKVLRDWTYSRFGIYTIDFWTTVANADGTINATYNFDGVHVNNSGHHIFFTRVVSERILDSLCLRSNNILPVANAGPDKTIILPTNSITLSGLGTDPDGSIISYSWSKASGPLSGTINSPAQAQTVVAGLVQGIYSFVLTVKDNKNAIDRDTVKVTVNCAPKIFYRDADRDGYGRNDIKVTACVAPAGYISLNGDCNDANAAIKPGAVELCNGIDDDCDGMKDDGHPLKAFYYDYDKDGFGSKTFITSACAAPTGYITISGDCNDYNAAVKPGAAELCNGIDDDCDGVIDEGLTQKTFYRDADKDGYGSKVAKASACSAPPGYISVTGDCNDANAAIRPGATEIANGIDDDCDGLIDEANLLVSNKVAPEMEHKEFDVRISAIPNPATDEFMIYFHGDGNTKLEVTVTDIYGRVFQQFQSLKAGKRIIIGSGYPKGVYFLKASQGSRSRVIKLVKG